VFAWGVAWLMEHLEPLSEALDSLAGDPDQIAANSRTWHNVAMRVTEAATDMRATVLRDIEEWSGPSAEAYQFTAQDQIDVLRAIAKAASAIGNGIHLAGVLVAALREVVRDLIFEGISTLAVRLPMWLAEVGFTLGAGTPWVTGQVATLVAQWVKRIGAFLKALIDSFRRLAPLLSQLDELIAALQTALRRTTQRDPADLGGTRNPDHLHGRSLTPEQLKSIRSFEARITEHQAKLEAYKADPWAYDNQGILERAPMTRSVKVSSMGGSVTWNGKYKTSSRK